MEKKTRRRCKNEECREWFHPAFANQWWCGPECGAKIALERRSKERDKALKAAEKKRRREEQQQKDRLKIRKLALKPLSYFHKLTQQAFNEYIRTRDAGSPCISCGRLTGAKMNAGHFRTVAASPETRYDETNCHIQCEHCNSYLSGNIGEYRPRLIEKIGHEAYEKLMGPHEKQKWTREDLQGLARHYRQKTKVLRESREEAA
ncbi:recombination protein NinG [Cronobacter dublinensis]|uniref:recombination protein NinG n=1 Tax=Cronobacter dublinensis TaxID=413497 RepID=UPI003ADD6D23